MKKIKNKYHLLVGSLLTTLLGFFGASCEEGLVPMYGVYTPENKLNIEGGVTSEDGLTQEVYSECSTEYSVDVKLQLKKK
jgi:hypothetical protein